MTSQFTPIAIAHNDRGERVDIVATDLSGVYPVLGVIHTLTGKYHERYTSAGFISSKGGDVGDLIDWPPKPPAPAPFDPSKPVQTRDGRKARIICADAVGEYPIVALIPAQDAGSADYECPTSFRANGHEFLDMEYSGDLINIPPEPEPEPEPQIGPDEVWINIYSTSNAGFLANMAHVSHDRADDRAAPDRIACNRYVRGAEMTPLTIGDEELIRALHAEAIKYREARLERGAVFDSKMKSRNDVVAVGLFYGSFGSTFNMGAALAGVHEATDACVKEQRPSCIGPGQPDAQYIAGRGPMTMIQPWMEARR